MKYSRAWIEKGYFDERPAVRVCDVMVDINARTIRIEWRDGAKQYVYEGVRSGQGHFLLRSDGAGGRATLHRFQYSPMLEGSWSGKGETGFWRIHLPQDAQAKVTRLLGAGFSPARRPIRARRIRAA